MQQGYSAQLEDGREIYIPTWPANVQFENLTQVCKLLGQDNVVNISTKKDLPIAMVAFMGSDDPQAMTQLMLHFVQQARIEGKKIVVGSLDELGMSTIMELFVHVLHSQYNDFFESGLAKVRSQES